MKLKVGYRISILAGLVLTSVVSAAPQTGGISVLELRESCEAFLKCRRHVQECVNTPSLMPKSMLCQPYIEGFRSGVFYGKFELAITDRSFRKENAAQFLERRSVSCVPDKVTDLQVMEVFVKRANQAPEELDSSAAEFLSVVLATTWPCSKNAQ